MLLLLWVVVPVCLLCVRCVCDFSLHNALQHHTACFAFPSFMHNRTHLSPSTQCCRPCAARNLVEEKSVLDCRRVSRKLQPKKEVNMEPSQNRKRRVKNLCVVQIWKLELCFSQKTKKKQHTIINTNVFLLSSLFRERVETRKTPIEIWLILPVVICLFQGLSHACLRITALQESAHGSLHQT